MAALSVQCAFPTADRGKSSGTRTYSKSLAVLYGILAVMGLIPMSNTLFGLAPLHGNDVWLHAVTAAIAAYFGWVAKTSTLAHPTAAAR